MIRKSTMEKEHFDYIDIAKGIGIFLVVIGHALSALPTRTREQTELIRTIIYLVHMPLFFYIGGMLFQSRLGKYDQIGFYNFAKRKASQYLIPYIVFSLILYILISILRLIPSFAWAVSKLGSAPRRTGDFLLSLFTYAPPVDDHLWFSYVMFIVLMISFLIRKADLRFLLIVFFAGYLSTWIISFPEIIWKVLRYMFLFTAGRLSQKCGVQYSKKNLILSAILCAAGIGCYLPLKAGNISLMACFKPLAEIGSSVFLLCLSNLIARANWSRHISKIGSYSYPIYLLHQPYIVPVILAIFSGDMIRNILGVVIAVVSGIIIPIFLYTFVIRKNRVIKLLLTGRQ